MRGAAPLVSWLAAALGLGACSGYSPWDASPCRTGLLLDNVEDLDLESTARAEGFDKWTAVDLDRAFGCPEIGGGVFVGPGASGVSALSSARRIGLHWLEVIRRDEPSYDPATQPFVSNLGRNHRVRPGALSFVEPPEDLAALSALEALHALELGGPAAGAELEPGQPLPTTAPGRSEGGPTSLTGLERLRRLDGLYLSGARRLASLAPIAGVEGPLEAVELDDVDALETWDGPRPSPGPTSLVVQRCDALRVLGPAPAPAATELRVIASPALEDLSALSTLRTVDQLELRQLPARTLDGLSGLTGAGTLRLQALPVASLAPLSGLQRLDRLELVDLPGLTELDALTALGRAGLRPQHVELRGLAGVPSCAWLAALEALAPVSASTWGPLGVDACTETLLRRFPPSLDATVAVGNFMRPVFGGITRVEPAPDHERGPSFLVHFDPAFDEVLITGGNAVELVVYASDQPIDRSTDLSSFGGGEQPRGAFGAVNADGVVRVPVRGAPGETVTRWFVALAFDQDEAATPSEGFEVRSARLTLP